jgi:predicted MFS family arabinose efflux permease
MTTDTQPNSPASDSLWSAFLPLLPLTVATFIGFFAMGMAMPVLPLHVHNTLGQSTVIVGVVMGAQFLSAILVGRLWAGAVSDARGPRPAALAGLLGVVLVVGSLYFASVLLFADRPTMATATLVAARLATGVAESFFITAMLTWGIARVGPAHTGKVIGWMGMALFGAYGAGAPVGVAVHAHFGFAGIAAATMLVPLAALALVWGLRGAAPSHAQPQPFYKVLGMIKLPGAGLTLLSVAYAMIMAFIALLFAQRGWQGTAYAFMALGVGFIVARFAFGHLPDKLGGGRLGIVCAGVQAVGQLLIWGAPGPAWAWVGAMLTGGAYALAFQGFGVESVRRAPPQSRGSAMGGYVAFQDLAMGLSAPLGGLLASAAGLDAVYLAGAVASLGSGVVAMLLLKAPPAQAASPG